MKMFKVLEPGTNEDVLGNAVPEGSIYVSVYPAPLPGRPHPKTLEVWESTLCRYNMSGTKGVYKVLRVEDDADAARRVR